MILFLFVLMVVGGQSFGQVLNCPNRETTKCISSMDQMSCPSNQVLIISDSVMCGICPSCGTGSGLNIPCTNQRPCLAGFKCLAGRCQLDPTQCWHLKYLEAQIKPLVYSWVPECNRDGSYNAIQCKGDRTSGRCFCFNEEGDRIFGWDWWRNVADMTCSCSRKRNKKERNGFLSTLHCSPNGNYEELQCEDDICWCADSKTGDLQPGTAAVPSSLWTLLPCYNATEMGSTYLRQCESAAFAQEKIKRKFELHGTSSITMWNILCDYDGTYGSYAFVSGSAVCTWRDGSRIGSFQVAANQVASMNCNCARDTKIFEENHLTLALACGGNGNYDHLQQVNQQAFCIDRDGFNVTGLLPLTPTPDCDTYLYYRNEALDK